MKRFLTALIACLLIFAVCFSFPVRAEEEEDELLAKEQKTVLQWYKQAAGKKITAGKGEPLWAGKAVFAVNGSDDEDVPFDLSCDFARHLNDFYGIASYSPILAETLEEAEVLVIVDAKYTKEGSYSNGANAYRTDTRAFVIDLTEKLLFGPYIMASEEPPRVIRSWGDAWGEFMAKDAVKELAEKWIETPEESSEEAYAQAQALQKEKKYGQALQKYIESQWKDWRKKAYACRQTMPKTGVLQRNKNVKGTQATLTFQRRQADKNSGFFARIYKGTTLAASLFIRGNGKASVKLPAGAYSIQVGMGSLWYGEKDAFGEEGAYYTCTFEDYEETLALKAKKTVTIDMEGEETHGIYSLGEYWEKKGNVIDVVAVDDLDWEEFRQ